MVPYILLPFEIPSTPRKCEKTTVRRLEHVYKQDCQLIVQLYPLMNANSLKLSVLSVSEKKTLRSSLARSFPRTHARKELLVLQSKLIQNAPTPPANDRLLLVENLE